MGAVVPARQATGWRIRFRGIDSVESIPGLHERLKTPALVYWVTNQRRKTDYRQGEVLKRRRTDREKVQGSFGDKELETVQCTMYVECT